MLKRKPVQTLLYVLGICIIPLVYIYSLFFLIGLAILVIAAVRIPLVTSKCPRCKKNNHVERWIQYYSCKWCRTSLWMEPDGWSYVNHHKSRISQ